MHTYRKRSGFTLVELMLVLSVIIVLGGVAIVGIRDYIRMGRRASTQATISVVTLAVNRFYYLHKTLPTNLLQLTQAGAGENGALLRAEDYRDSWNRELRYSMVHNVEDVRFSIWSMGQDGANNSGDNAPDNFQGDDIGVCVRI